MAKAPQMIGDSTWMSIYLNIQIYCLHWQCVFPDSTLPPFTPDLSITEDNVVREILAEMETDSNWRECHTTTNSSDGQLCDLDIYTPYGDEPRIRVFLHDNSIECQTITCQLGKFHLLPIEHEAAFCASDRDVSTTWLLDSSVHLFVSSKLTDYQQLKLIAPGVIFFPPEIYEAFMSFRSEIQNKCWVVFCTILL